MLRHVFVVARDSAYLAGYLRDRFKDRPEVEIVMDRRRGERRREKAEAAEAAPDRRGSDRRARPTVDEELRLSSCVFVTLPQSEDA